MSIRIEKSGNNAFIRVYKAVKEEIRSQRELKTEEGFKKFLENNQDNNPRLRTT